jgi:hypothetical protein
MPTVREARADRQHAGEAEGSTGQAASTPTTGAGHSLATPATNADPGTASIDNRRASHGGHAHSGDKAVHPGLDADISARLVALTITTGHTLATRAGDASPQLQ